MGFAPVAGAACLLVFALAIRLSLLTRSGWLLEGDDALSTLMALGVLDGDRPIMLKNQTYASAWEPYAMAVSYALFGVSRISAKLPALLGSLALIGTTWLLAREVSGRAAAWFAAALLAVPAAYPLVLWLKPWAPYTEVVLFGSLSLMCAVRLAWPRPGIAAVALGHRSGASSDALLGRPCWKKDAVWSLGWGIAGGIALWMHPLAAWYLAAGAVCVLARVRGSRWLAIVGSGLVGLLLGGLPIWVFNLQTGGATLRFVLAGSQGQTADRVAVAGAWWNNDLPRGAGLFQPWGDGPVAVMWSVVLGAAIVVSLGWAVVGRRRLELRPLDTLLVLLVLMPTLFVLSGFGGPALNPWGFDATGRYAPPIWAGLAVVLGAALAAAWRARRWLGLGLAGVVFAANVGMIASIEPVRAFQSPYWDKLPADNSALLAALDEEHVQYVWMNHWAGQPVMFDARVRGQTLYAYDWYDVHAGHGIDRFPEYLALVEQSERPAFVLVTDEEQPELETRLRQMGVSLVERRVPPYVVVRPTSRRVHPAEVESAIDYRY